MVKSLAAGLTKISWWKCPHTICPGLEKERKLQFSILQSLPKKELDWQIIGSQMLHSSKFKEHRVQRGISPPFFNQPPQPWLPTPSMETPNPQQNVVVAQSRTLRHCNTVTATAILVLGLLKVFQVRFWPFRDGFPWFYVLKMLFSTFSSLRTS